MKKRVLLPIGLVVVLIGALLALPDKPPCPDAVTLSYVGSGQFWLSNTTAKTVVAQLWYVESNHGTNWIQWAAPNHRLELQPHSGTVDVIFSPSQPTPTNTWRLRGAFGEKLDGFAAVRMALRYYPSTISYRVRTGDTNMSFYPFPKGTSWYGKHRELVSVAVSE